MRNTAIARWARESRKAAGFSSSAAAAEQAGIDPVYLRKLEAGHVQRPGQDKLDALARVYGVTPPDLDAITPLDADEAERLEFGFEMYRRGWLDAMRQRDGHE